MGNIYKRDSSWGIDYRDHRGRRVRRVVATDKSVAQKLLGDALDAAEKMRAGILLADPREGKRAIGQPLSDYIAELQRRGRDGMYVYIIKKHVEGAIWDQGWVCLSDCSVRGVSAYLRTLARRGLTAKTVNVHRADLAAFFGWCVRTGRLEANPCEQVPKSADPRGKTRRALAVGECRDLLGAAPPTRKTVYLFLLYTGLRRAEAAALRWGHLHLDLANPYVELPALLTKSGKPETVPLVRELAVALRQHRGGAHDRDPVFESIPSMVEFRADLAAAGITEVDHRGRRVVLHSLRHSLATMLAVSGVPMAVAQKILRHRDIRLTAQVHCDEALLPLAAAMASLPSLTGPAPAAGSLGLTGTTGDQNVPTSGHNGAPSGTATAPAASAGAS